MKISPVRIIGMCAFLVLIGLWMVDSAGLHPGFLMLCGQALLMIGGSIAAVIIALILFDKTGGYDGP